MENNIVRAKVTIKGTRPLLFHHFGRHALPLEKQEKTGVAGNDPEDWRKTCLVTGQGQLYIQDAYVFATIREGAKFTKKGRGSLQSDVSATLQVEEERIMLDRWYPGFENNKNEKKKFDVKNIDPPSEDDEAAVYLDVRGVRNPTTRARNVRYRLAAKTGWQCTFTLLWDKTVISRTQMETILLDAGKLVGVGNGRAIGMGRFAVESLEVIEE